PVLVTGFLHNDLAVFLDDRGPDLGRLAVDEHAQIGFAVENRDAGLLDTLGAQRVGLARPSQRRKAAITALEQGSRRPVRLNRGTLERLIELANQRPGGAGSNRSHVFK